MEAKYPALLFKQQLDAFVQKIFPMIRDNVRKEISPMLSNCIHTPKTSTRTAARPGSTSAGDKAAGESRLQGPGIQKYADCCLFAMDVICG